MILLQGCYLKTASDCTYVYFILSSVFYVIVAVCQLLIKDFLISDSDRFPLPVTLAVLTGNGNRGHLSTRAVNSGRQLG